MRKLKLQMQMSLDGFITGPNGEMDWMTLPWTDDLNLHVKNFSNSIDTIILGRKLAENFIPYWDLIAKDNCHPEQLDAKFFTETPKIVFSRTISQTDWPNTELTSDDLKDKIQQLKSSEGRDIVIYGGGNLVNQLIDQELIDELHLYLNPIVLGKGKSIFEEIQSDFQLINSTPFECGIIALEYKTNKTDD